MLKKIKKLIHSCYMCIKYPFLYPRNRFTGLHYNNWKVIEFAKKLVQKYSVYKFEETQSEVSFSEYKKKYFYVKQNGRSINYWVNWWSYPLWKLVKFYHDVILQIIHCIPTYNEWNAMEKGWDKAFGKQYLQELKQQLIKDKMLYSFRITDIKEKWGRCNLYCAKASHEVYNIIDKYENLSWDYCIKCGKPSKYISKGWISPYCEDCIDKEHIDHYVDKEEYSGYVNDLL